MHCQVAGEEWYQTYQSQAVCLNTITLNVHLPWCEHMHGVLCTTHSPAQDLHCVTPTGHLPSNNWLYAHPQTPTCTCTLYIDQELGLGPWVSTPTKCMTVHCLKLQQFQKHMPLCPKPYRIQQVLYGPLVLSHTKSNNTLLVLGTKPAKTKQNLLLEFDRFEVVRVKCDQSQFEPLETE